MSPSPLLLPTDPVNGFVLHLDAQGRILSLNPSGARSLGYASPEDVLGQAFSTLQAQDDPGTRTEPGTNACASSCASPRYGALRRRDGSRIDVGWSINPAPNDGRILIGVRINGDESLAEQSQTRMFQTVVEHYHGSIVITDAERRILYVNPSVTQMTGYTEDELLGETPAIFNSGDTPRETFEEMWRTLNQGEIWRGHFVNRRKDGSIFVENKMISAISDDEGKVQYYLSIGEDFSQHHHYRQRVENLLTFDEQTGLPNRSAFLREVADAIVRGRDNDTLLTILYVDIEHLSAASLMLGPQGIDFIIGEIALRLRAILRHEDVLGRVSHDKFAILLQQRQSVFEVKADEIATRVLCVLNGQFSTDAGKTSLSASIGIATHPSDGQSASEIFETAVTAAEQARAEGGDRYCIYTPGTRHQATSRLELLDELRHALERNEFILYYQPQLSLFSGEIIGLEALIRWQHPTRGLVLPGTFIPVAEHTGLIVQIGEWVIRSTCAQMRAWLDAGLPALKVSLNLAARHFLDPALHQQLEQALSAHGLNARHLELEITEGTMMQDIAAAVRCTTRLKEIGVRIVLDDFGTGYSSLAYLSRFPVDAVKLEHSFVQDITTNPTNAAIAQATIAMAHKLGKLVIAEGIETEEQMRYLRRCDCDEMQGYFFARPQPAEEITRMMQAGTRLSVLDPNAPEKTKTVLFVDDEANIISSIKRTLRREGYQVLTANSAAEGLSLLAKQQVHVIVSDQRMPEMNGTEFLSRVKTMHPKTIRMVLSGYSELSAVTDAINKGAVYRFMLKPWEDDRLKQEINEALRQWEELYGSKE